MTPHLILNPVLIVSEYRLAVTELNDSQLWRSKPFSQQLAQPFDGRAEGAFGG
jgi:hypothetical protein